MGRSVKKRARDPKKRRARKGQDQFPPRRKEWVLDAEGNLIPQDGDQLEKFRAWKVAKEALKIGGHGSPREADKETKTAFVKSIGACDVCYRRKVECKHWGHLLNNFDKAFQQLLLGKAPSDIVSAFEGIRTTISQDVGSAPPTSESLSQLATWCKSPQITTAPGLVNIDVAHIEPLSMQQPLSYAQPEVPRQAAWTAVPTPVNVGTNSTPSIADQSLISSDSIPICRELLLAGDNSIFQCMHPDPCRPGTLLRFRNHSRHEVFHHYREVHHQDFGQVTVSRQCLALGCSGYSDHGPMERELTDNVPSRAPCSFCGSATSLFEREYWAIATRESLAAPPMTVTTSSMSGRSMFSDFGHMNLGRGGNEYSAATDPSSTGFASGLSNYVLGYNGLKFVSDVHISLDAEILGCIEQPAVFTKLPKCLSAFENSSLMLSNRSSHQDTKASRVWSRSRVSPQMSLGCMPLLVGLGNLARKPVLKMRGVLTTCLSPLCLGFAQLAEATMASIPTTRLVDLIGMASSYGATAMRGHGEGE